MTDSQLRFEIPFARKAIAVGFDGGLISSDGGLLLLRRIDERLGLTKRLAKCVKDVREQKRVEQTETDSDRRRRDGRPGARAAPPAAGRASTGITAATAISRFWSM